MCIYISTSVIFALLYICIYHVCSLVGVSLGSGCLEVLKIVPSFSESVREGESEHPNIHHTLDIYLFIKYKNTNNITNVSMYVCVML